MGYGNVCSKLSVVNGTSAYSQPISMAGTNAFRFGVTVFNLGGASGITLTPQGSVDGENWDNLTSSSSLGLGYNSFTQSQITYAMVRLKMTVDGTGTVILAADCQTSHQ
jgi:hypothetical protein